MKSFRIYLNLPISLAALALFSVLYLAASLYAQPGPFFDTVSHLAKSGAWIYFVNWLPIFLLAALIYFALNSCALAVSLSGAVFGVLSVANYFKIKMRQAPLWPWDFALGGEVLGVAKSFSTFMVSMLVVFIIGLFAFIVISAVFVRNRPLAAWIRIAGVVSVLLTGLLCGKFIYAGQQLYDNAYVHGNRYNEADRYNSRGFVYSFTHVLLSSRVEKPPGYDKQAARDFLEALPPSDIKKPHIIMIMSEAFSDIPLNPALDFTGYTDPLAHYKELKSVSESGYIAVPNIGGGTADTEFDVLTGVNTRNYRGVPYTFKLVTKPTASLVTELAGFGYSNVAIHPGYSWFYNRASAFPYLGFERFIHLDDFDPASQSKGGYINETVTIDRVISELERHISSSDAPFFEFCITIQNHGPYQDKYSTAEKNFETALGFTEPQLNSLYNYFLGLADADRELKRLHDYLQNCPEPVVLVYFGDHLPSLDYDVYDKLIPEGEPGRVSGETKLFRTPYLIWGNPAAQISSPTANETISSSYLGALLFRMLGGGGYFGYAARVSDDYPVVFESRYATSDGGVHEGDTPEALAILKELEYYRFFSDS